jgi:hypothetical protein
MTMVNSSIAHKIVGYFSCSITGHIFCDGDACIIAGTEELMYSYIKAMLSDNKTQDIVRKTKFAEIISGLDCGGAYAFDKAAYVKFFSLAKKYGLCELPEPNSFFSELSPTELHFIRIKFDGG